MNLNKIREFFVKYGDVLGIGLISMASLCYIIFSILANADLAEGRFALFMDEIITFDGVRSILHPGSLSNFIYGIVDGGDHRYGRFLWNALAIVSFLPESIYFEKGQIFASRMLLPASLLTAYVLMIFTFIRNNIYRFVALLLLLTLPFSVYYSSMPKPEPLQLLFFSLFIVSAKKNDFLFGYYWICLGLALALKVSLLPIIPFLMALSLYKEIQNHSWYRVFVSSLMVVAGFLLSELYMLKIFFDRTFTPIKQYIVSIMGNARFGADDHTISVMDWLSYIVKGYSGIPMWMIIIVLIVSVAVITCYIVQYYNNTVQMKLLQRVIGFIENDGILFIILGIIMLLPIVLFVKRIWGFYLHTGTVFIILGIMAIAEQLIVLTRTGIQRFLGHSVVVLFAAVSLVFCVPNTVYGFNELSQRTHSDSYEKQYKEYICIKDFLNRIHPYINKRMSIYYDPELFSILSNKKYNIVPFWGYFLHWEQGYDFVIYREKHAYEGKLPAKTNVSYQLAKMEKELYAEYVIKKDKPIHYNSVNCCLQNIRIFVRGDIFQRIKKVNCCKDSQ